MAALIDLKPENYVPYLKMITESIIISSGNVGSLRKDMWSYLMKKYTTDHIDYGQFLLAIRKFMNEGRMTNKEGFYTMHPEVIIEFNKNHGSDESLEVIKKAAAIVER
jgi:hypothetical protein